MKMMVNAVPRGSLVGWFLLLLVTWIAAKAAMTAGAGMTAALWRPPAFDMRLVPDLFPLVGLGGAVDCEREA